MTISYTFLELLLSFKKRVSEKSQTGRDVQDFLRMKQNNVLDFLILGGCLVWFIFQFYSSSYFHSQCCCLICAQWSRTFLGLRCGSQRRFLPLYTILLFLHVSLQVITTSIPSFEMLCMIAQIW